MQKTAVQLIGKNLWHEFPVLLETKLHEEYMRASSTGLRVSFEFVYPSDSRRYFVSAYPHSEGLTVFFRDVTDAQELEVRANHNMKMTAIGQLTGGIAHDFNNLLTVILGCMENLLCDDSAYDEVVRNQLVLVQKAGIRAADLTHRLLAFARKQPLAPYPSAINELIAEMLPLARMTLGESIDLQVAGSTDLSLAVIDSHELQNALLNLLINARDAMEGQGKVTIETANKNIDGHSAELSDIKPGEYILIAVSDSGKGMNRDEVARAFEPFFTTKSAGLGSGLGLSMVYGFVKQSGGDVKIYSEVGIGTTVKIFLPRVSGVDVQAEQRVVQTNAVGGNERILVVEDDVLVRTHTKASLERLGYKVSTASDGVSAISALADGLTVDVLLTDVVLPGGSTGRQIARDAREILPDVKVVYMSGYTEHAIVHQGRVDERIFFLTKPFRLVDLDGKIRQAIDNRP